MKRRYWVGVMLGLWGTAKGAFSPYQTSLLQGAKLQEETAVLSAKIITYDRENEVFCAEGDVILRQEARTLTARRLIYDKKQDRIFALGPLSLTDSNGDVITGCKVKWFNQAQWGEVSDAFMLTAARERFAAKRIAKKGENIEEFDMVSYTPCEKCEDHLPVWSLHARKIVKDNQDNTMTYTDAHLEMLGVPVAYIPHFYLPLKRKSGFLMPQLSATEELGLYMATPYYVAISEDKDITLTPFATTKGGMMFAQAYRQQFNWGRMTLKGAVNPTHAQTFQERSRTVATIPPVRGYLYGDLIGHLSPHWRLQMQEWWTTDKTFLTTRPFFGQSTAAFLESNTVLDGFYDRHFVHIQGMRYQGLQETDSSKTTPLIYPKVVYQYTIPEGPWGSYALLDIETLSLYQRVGTQLQRGIIDGWWFLPLHTPQGLVISPFAHIDGAFYAPRIQDEGTTLYHRYTVGRFFPQAGFLGQWPLMAGRLGLITPMVQGIAGRARVNKDKIPDKDSQGVTFTDAVLFEANRFPGYDRVDEGMRVNYALQWDGFFSASQTAQLFVGQSYSFSPVPMALYAVGARKGLSDIVGRLETSFMNPEMTLRYRFRFCPKPLKPGFQELSARMGMPILMVTGGYIFFNPRQDPRLDGYNQLFMTLNSQFWSYWNAQVFVTQNFRALYQRRELLDKGFSIGYQDDCFSCSIVVRHSYYQMRDLRPGISVDFAISLKNLGGFRQHVDRFSRVQPPSLPSTLYQRGL